jgi:hypothetical protein
MHSIDMSMEFKGASNKRAELTKTETLEWTYLMALNNTEKFRMYLGDGNYDGMMLRDDGVSINVDPEFVYRITNGQPMDVA